jgi:predicted dehydrogenase
MTRSPRSALIGAGFIGEVHARAVRAAGGTLVAVADGTERNAAAAAVRFGARRSGTADEILADPEVDLVHICTPNHLHADLAMRAIKAGKHVICEKPLATSAESARRLTESGSAAGVVAAVPFVYRFYPTVRDVRTRINRGEAGPVQVMHGSYLQDWLASTEDNNWRVDSTLGGPSRAFGDIGVHWCDLVEFTSGHRIVRLCAKLLTAHTRRRSGDALTSVGTEDVATLMFETDQGALGTAVISQVSHGRKNRLWFSLDCAQASLSFNQELPDSLWIGGREKNCVVSRGSVVGANGATRYNLLPAGHPQGYQDCFNAFVTDVYAAIEGGCPDGLPRFADGYRSAVLTEAVLESAKSSNWVEVIS